MSTRRTIAAITLAVAAPFSLSACGTSFGAQTNQQYQPGEGSNLRTGPIGVYNGLFVDNGDGSLTFSGALLAKDAQTIEAVSVDGAAKKLARPITLKPNTLLTLGSAGDIIVKTKDVEAGDYVTISFAALPGGDISLEVPVVERTSEYADVAKRPTSGATQAPQEQEPAPATPETEDSEDDTSPPSQ